MRTSGVFRVAALCVILALTAAAAHSSQAQAPPAGVPASPKPPTDASKAAAQASPAVVPIPLSMIALEAESATVKVRRIRREMDEAFSSTAMETRLAASTGTLKPFRPLLESDAPHLDELLNLRQELRRVSLMLIKSQSILTPYSQAVEARQDELQKMESLWNVTSAAASRQDVPQSTRELIRTVQSEVRDAQHTIATDRPGLLALQGRISERRIAVDDLLVQTDAAIDKSRSRLLTIDSEPLWKAIAAARLSTSLQESVQSFYHRRALPVFDYLRDDRERLWTHLLISIVLTFLLSAMSRSSRGWFDPQAGDTQVAQVLRHPVAAAIVLALISSFYIYPNAPITLYQLPLVLMVIPLVRLLSEALQRDERRMFYSLTGIFLLRRLDEVLASDDFLHRIFLLVVTGVAMAGVLRAAAADRRAAAKGIGPWRRARMYLVRLAGLILIGSLIANVVGSVGLSTLLADSCISSAFAGLVLFGAVLALEGYLIPILRSPLVRISPAIRNYRDLFQRRGFLLFRVIAVAIWTVATLGMFGLWAPFRSQIVPVLVRQWSFGQMTFSLRGILVFGLTIWVSSLAARFAGFLIEEDITTRMTLPQGIPATISMLVRNSIVILGFILALAGAGLQWNQIALVAGAIGVGIGLGLQNLVASVVAGLILTFERPIRVGDSVEFGGTTGVVTRIGLRSSTIRTYDGSEVISPNSNLISKELINWTLSDQIRRVDVTVGAAYGSDPRTVLKILLEVAGNHPGVLKKPEPVALFRGFGDSSLNFILRFFSTINDAPVVNSEVGIRINEQFRDAGIEIPFPQRDIRITSEPAIPIEEKRQFESEKNER